MASKQLPGVIELLTDSWHFFITQWNESLRITIWLVYIGLIQFGLSLLMSVSPFFNLLFIPAEVGVLILSLWVGVRIIQVLLQLEAGKKPSYSKEVMQNAWKLILPLLWVAVLMVLIIFGGSILFILPGIYFAVVLGFSNFYLIEDDAHGLAALAKSRDLVKGRFWPTLWRMFAGGVVLFVGLAIVMSLLFSLLAVVAGPQHLMGLSSYSGTYELNPLAQGTLDLLESLIQAAILPLIFGYQIKLYRALRKTR